MVRYCTLHDAKTCVAPVTKVPGTLVLEIQPSLILASVTGSITASMNLKENSVPFLNLFVFALSKTSSELSLLDSIVASLYAPSLTNDASEVQ